MKSLFIAYILGIGAAVALAGCGTPSAMPQTPAVAARTSDASQRISSTYETLYSFAGGSDGANPDAGVIEVGGTLYGTTSAGGTHPCRSGSSYGCGTVYSLTPGGTERVLHDFGAGSDGGTPLAKLVDAGGTLYGTTVSGGTQACYGSYYGNCGTVFSITRRGKESVLHSFSGYNDDGAYPHASLINVNGTLYGTTVDGGGGECYYSGRACGTVFSITRAGAEKILHGFSGHPDGGFPYARLLDVKGTLYGTTSTGGKHFDGAVFSIATDGTEKVLHSFGAGSDGRYPHAGLIDVRGTLYGTTAGGGAYSCSSRAGCGTVFSITPGGTEKVLHSFGKGTDGENPEASLVALKGTLYGTTLSGGTHTCGSHCGGGTVFSVTLDGRERVLHSFGGIGDGRSPNADLVMMEGTLYGTTTYDGAHGYGTVFALTP